MNQEELITSYRLIAELFLYPEERDGDRIDADFAALQATSEVRASIETFFSSPLSASADEYISTLELKPLVSLYLGSFLFDEPASCRGAGMSGRNAYMLELTNIYRHFGVEFSGKEMSDFVPVVVEFLGLSLDRMDADKIGLRRYFVETLLVNAIECLLSDLRKADSPYRHLIEALRIAIAEDIAQMAGGPIWQRPAEADVGRVPGGIHDPLADEFDLIEKRLEQ